MLQERIERRVGRVQKIGTHRIYGYKLIFNCRGFANIEKASPLDYVEGVVYALTAWQLYELDMFEALYTREEFPYKKDASLQVYVGIPYYCSFYEVKPFKSYLRIILAGCIENDLTTLYNTLKEKFTFKLKAKRTSSKRRLF